MEVFAYIIILSLLGVVVYNIIIHWCIPPGTRITAKYIFVAFMFGPLVFTAIIIAFIIQKGQRYYD